MRLHLIYILELLHLYLWLFGLYEFQTTHTNAQQLHVFPGTKYASRVRSYKAEAKRLEQEFSRAKYENSSQYDRSELLGEEPGENQRARLIENSSSVERSTKRLEAGYKLAAETEDIGVGILGELHLQVRKYRQFNEVETCIKL